jgi:hypothetical protein
MHTHTLSLCPPPPVFLLIFVLFAFDIHLPALFLYTASFGLHHLHHGLQVSPSTGGKIERSPEELESVFVTQ